MTSKAEENAERIRVLRNDQAVRDGSTLSDFAQAEASVDRGRYSHISKPVIAKSSADYPQASGPWSGEREPDEPLCDGTDCA
jgi:hypothetical protein